MTEEDQVLQAKKLIDSLANGTDPATDQALPEDTVLNRPEVIRCFFYVSNILRQVAENGGQIGAQKKERKRPFQLTLAQRAAVDYSATPLPLSRFLDRLNDLRSNPEQMRKLSFSTVSSWLMEKGFLVERETASGGHTKCPTEHGLSIGLSQELRHSTVRNQDYMVTLYNEAAQRFLVDNLDDILGT